MRIRMDRIFHPVGQGAYYEERFYDVNRQHIFNFVYDCGTKSKRDRINDIIKNDKKKKIDLLCISHFDSDHISHIKDLKNKMEIKNVMMPLLDLEDLLISLVYISNGEEEFLTYANMLLNPVEFFRKEDSEPTIIFVSEKKDKNASLNDMEDIKIEDINKKEITVESGQKLIFKNIWNYIPFNYQYNEKKDVLIEKIKNNLSEIDFNKGEQDVKEQILGKIDDNKFIGDLKSCYDEIKATKLEGDPSNTNINSLVVYSGPMEQINNYNYRNNYNYYNHNYNYNLECSNNTGCLYCGDYNAKDVNSRDALITFYEPYKEKIEIIQIPHHGSKNNYSEKIVKNIPKALISHGRQHGHPSDEVIKSLESRNKKIIEITQNSPAPYIGTIIFDSI